MLLQLSLASADVLCCCARRYEQVETAEYAGMFKWFEEATFPDPAGARETLRRLSLGLYPGAIKGAMAVFDIVESIAVSRTRVCVAGGIHALTRIQVSTAHA